MFAASESITDPRRFTAFLNRSGTNFISESGDQNSWCRNQYDSATRENHARKRHRSRGIKCQL